MPRELYAGVMSGTSLDGVDAVLADFAPAEGLCTTLGAAHAPMDLLATFQDENVPTAEVSRLLDRCLAQLDRLRLDAPVMISLVPPHPQAERLFLFERVCSRGDQMLEIEIPYPLVTDQPSLF